MGQRRPLFRLFSSFRTVNLLSSQQDSNWDRQSRRQERWPLDHHHGPTFGIFGPMLDHLSYCPENLKLKLLIREEWVRIPQLSTIMPSKVLRWDGLLGTSACWWHGFEPHCLQEASGQGCIQALTLVVFNQTWAMAWNGLNYFGLGSGLGLGFRVLAFGLRIS